MEDNLHTVKILDLIVTEDMSSIFIVMTYMPSDLKNILSLDTDQAGLTQNHTIKILFRMLCALNFIHKANVMHRDLTPAKILIDNDCNLLLCDFDLARTSTKIEKKKKYYSR